MVSSGTPLLHPMANAARRLGIGRTRLYEEIAAGRIRQVHIGRKALIAEDELLAYVHRLSDEPH